jgi:uncharacterized protein (TIGR03067 family)
MSTYQRPFTMWPTVAEAVGMLGLITTVLVGAPTLGVAQPAAGKTATSALMGSYTIVAGEKDGQKIPDEHVQGSSVRIAENAITTFDNDQKETYAASYTLDTSREPWRITMTSTLAPIKGEVAQGLIKQDGDTVQLIYAVRGGTTPTDFTTEDRQLLFTLKKSGAHTAPGEAS